MKTILGGMLTAVLYCGALAALDAWQVQLGDLPGALLAGLCGFLGFWAAHNLPKRTPQ